MGKMGLVFLLGIMILLPSAGFAVTDDSTTPPTSPQEGQAASPEEDWWEEWDESEQPVEEGLVAEAKPQATKPVPKPPAKKILLPPAAVKK